MSIIGKGFTVMIKLSVLSQPFASVPVTVYVVVPKGGVNKTLSRTELFHE